jgi:hypothetical protein
MSKILEEIWVFSDVESDISAGVFKDKDAAIPCIMKHKLSGTLTKYPVG